MFKFLRNLGRKVVRKIGRFVVRLLRNSPSNPYEDIVFRAVYNAQSQFREEAA